MSSNVPRWQKNNIIETMAVSRVLLISGARQCGKTTLAKELENADTEYRTLDDVALKQAAENDPHGFVKHNKKTLIIDEIQRVPLLLPAIKKAVDEDTRTGQYLLTGSANIQAMPSAQESLAGRIAKLKLRPLTMGERLQIIPNFLEKAFAGNLTTPKKHYDKASLLEIACIGGYPEALQLNERQRKNWHRNYMNAILERDLKDIAKIQNFDAMKELVHILAAWSSKFMNLSQIGSSLSIKQPTLISYMNALEALFITERVKPWTKTDYDRVGKHDKIFMSDTGLMASLLGWNVDRIQFDDDKSGKLMESFAFQELMAQVEYANGEYELKHYRDRQKREIDFIVEREDEAMLGIEIKSGTNIGASDFKHMKWFKENIAGDRPFKGIILYSGEHLASFGEDMIAVPFGAVWE